MHAYIHTYIRTYVRTFWQPEQPGLYSDYATGYMAQESMFPGKGKRILSSATSQGSFWTLDFLGGKPGRALS
jgi:hypothetical protein